MSDILASHCEAKKHALRQTQDGIVVSFVLHPNEVPAALQLAPLGTRYMLAFAEIGDDEKPVNRKEGDAPAGSNPTIETAPAPTVPNSSHALARARKPVAAEKRLAQQAGILCADPVFQRYLLEHHMMLTQDEEGATLAVRMICGVSTRADIVPGTAAGSAWEALCSKFIAWKIAA